MKSKVGKGLLLAGVVGLVTLIGWLAYEFDRAMRIIAGINRFLEGEHYYD